MVSLPNNYISDEDWKEIIGLYFDAKSLVALAELSERDLLLSVPAIVELRSAYDHLMRVMQALLPQNGDGALRTLEIDSRPKVPDNDEDKKEYCVKNLSKIKGHLYRTIFDALDVLVITALIDVIKYTQRFDFDDIHQAIPDFPNDVARIEEIKKKVGHCKTQKSASSGDSEGGKPNFNGNLIEEYLTAYSDIKKIARKIEERSLIIRANEQKRRRQGRMTILIGICASVIAAIVVAAGVWLSSYLPGPKQTPPPVESREIIRPAPP